MKPTNPQVDPNKQVIFRKGNKEDTQELARRAAASIQESYESTPKTNTYHSENRRAKEMINEPVMVDKRGKTYSRGKASDSRIMYYATPDMPVSGDALARAKQDKTEESRSQGWAKRNVGERIKKVQNKKKEEARAGLSDSSHLPPVVLE